jgi:hypothetical protein
VKVDHWEWLQFLGTTRLHEEEELNKPETCGTKSMQQGMKVKMKTFCVEPVFIEGGSLVAQALVTRLRTGRPGSDSPYGQGFIFFLHHHVQTGS